MEDRLLLEAVHTAWRSTRGRAERRVVTSDVLFARILHAEGLTPLFLQTVLVPEEPVPCMRFEPLSQRFEGAPLPSLLWDLAHTFGTVRLRRVDDEQVIVELSAYWPRKSFQDWKAERLQARFPTRPVVASANLLDVLRLGGALLSAPSTLEELSRSPSFSAQGSIREVEGAAEVLLGSGLAVWQGPQLLATELLKGLDEALGRGDLDSVSTLLAKYRPYGVLLEELETHRVVERKFLDDVLQGFTGNAAAFDQLIRFPVLLGQTWTQAGDDVLRDGSKRPSPEAFAEVFRAVFASVEKQGLVSVAELIPLLCAECSMSPWAVRRMLMDEVDVTRMLPEFDFEPAAAVRRTGVVGEVVVGSLSKPMVARLSATFVIGGKPVLAVVRRGQP